MSPVIVPFVDLQEQYERIRADIDTAISSVMHDGAFIRGKYVTAFENDFAHAYGARNCISVANGTDALFVCLKSLGVGNGDEVITPAHSWISSSEVITQAGAKVVFADVERDYYTTDPLRIAEKISHRTKAIIVVHLFGQPANMNAIGAIAHENGLPILEDCAQSHFAEVDGRRVGLYGTAAAFSFYPSKNLGAYGDAGAIITQNDAFAKKAAAYARHGADTDNKHDHKIEGMNSRMDGIQAAVLSVKLPYVHQWNALRRLHAAFYNELLDSVEEVETPMERAGAFHVYHIYQIRCRRRDSLRRFLAEKGIATAVHYPVALPFLTAYEYLGHKAHDFPVAYKSQSEILSLPMYPELAGNQQRFVVDAIKEFYRTG